MSSFLYPDSATRKLYNQSLTFEEIERRQAKREASKQKKEQSVSPIVQHGKTFFSNVFNKVKTFFSRGKH